ncbi:MAG TPA: DUF5329 family protein [Planctomycetota bacterium]|nr:DUF5329 family protein [Planctomycetota bacterium]
MRTPSSIGVASARTLLGCILVSGLTQSCEGPEAPRPAPPTSPPLSAPPVPPPAATVPPKPVAEDAAAVIEQLIGTIAASPLVFIRNGSEHTGEKASAHIRDKYEHYKKSIATPEDFIAKAASKSELSGKPYLVKLADGREAELSGWLSERLVELRKAAAAH